MKFIAMKQSCEGKQTFIYCVYEWGCECVCVCVWWERERERVWERERERESCVLRICLFVRLWVVDFYLCFVTLFSGQSGGMFTNLIQSCPLSAPNNTQWLDILVKPAMPGTYWCIYSLRLNVFWNAQNTTNYERAWVHPVCQLFLVEVLLYKHSCPPIGQALKKYHSGRLHLRRSLRNK